MAPRLGRNFIRFAIILLVMAVAGWAVAQTAPAGAASQGSLGIPGMTINLGTPGANPKANQDQVSSSLQILALLTVLSLAPALLILTTAFSRIVIILSFVRSALGTPTIPPNQVVIGLSLFLTMFVMAPTYKEVNKNALEPYFAKKITTEQAIERGSKPVRAFMLKNTYESDLLLFVKIRNERPKTKDEVELTTLIPAFIISELKTAFIVGFYIFIPFLIIDLVVASALMSMGMMMLSPQVVSLPAKILVFVLANGWATLVGAIVAGYR